MRWTRLTGLMVVLVVVTVSCAESGLKSFGSSTPVAVAPLPITEKTEESRVALVIGNGAYKSAPLSTSVNDAQAMDEALKTLGFDVVQQTDVSRKEFRMLIREFSDRLRKSSGVGLFYYSGHGMQVNGRNYMIPIDADIQSEADVEDDGVTVNSVLAQMEAANSNPNIVILDACRDNPFEKRYKSTQKGLASIGAPGGTLIAYATAPGQVADSGPRRGNSPFTAILVREIAVPASSAWVTFNRVAKRVIDITGGQQKPYLEISAYFPDFSFKPAPPDDDWSPPDCIAIFVENPKTALISQRDIEDRFLMGLMQKGYGVVSRSDVDNVVNELGIHKGYLDVLKKFGLNLKLTNADPPGADDIAEEFGWGPTNADACKMGDRLHVTAVMIVSVGGLNIERQHDVSHVTGSMVARLISVQTCEIVWINSVHREPSLDEIFAAEAEKALRELSVMTPQSHDIPASGNDDVGPTTITMAIILINSFPPRIERVEQDVSTGTSGLGGLLGATGSYLDDPDKRTAGAVTQQALESNRSGTTATWRNPDSGHSGSVTPIRTYQDINSQHCRDYEQKVTIDGKPQKSYGTACRQADGSWQIVS